MSERSHVCLLVCDDDHSTTATLTMKVVEVIIDVGNTLRHI